jgi:hypothetical protein
MHCRIKIRQYVSKIERYVPIPDIYCSAWALQCISKIEIGNSMIKKTTKYNKMRRTEIYKIFDYGNTTEQQNKMIAKYINQIDEIDRRMTPLIYAMINGHLGCAKLLIENGANVNIVVDGRCETALIALISDFNKSTTAYDVLKLMLDRGANVNPPNVKKSPFQIAVKERLTMVITILLNYGAKVEGIDFSKCSSKIYTMLTLHMRCTYCNKVGKMQNKCACYDETMGKGLCGDCVKIMAPKLECKVCGGLLKLRVNMSNLEKFALPFVCIMFLLAVMGRIHLFDLGVAMLVAFVIRAWVSVSFRENVNRSIARGLIFASTCAIFVNGIVADYGMHLLGFTICAVAIVCIQIGIDSRHGTTNTNTERGKFSVIFGRPDVTFSAE